MAASSRLGPKRCHHWLLHQSCKIQQWGDCCRSDCQWNQFLLRWAVAPYHIRMLSFCQHFHWNGTCCNVGHYHSPRWSGSTIFFVVHESQGHKVRHFSPVFFLVPSTAPVGLSGTVVSSTSLLLSWSAPLDDTHNGVIVLYTVFVVEIDTGMTFYHNTTKTSLALTSLHPYYQYECSVAAVTVGYGPYTSVFSLRTEQDGMWK